MHARSLRNNIQHRRKFTQHTHIISLARFLTMVIDLSLLPRTHLIKSPAVYLIYIYSTNKHYRRFSLGQFTTMMFDPPIFRGTMPYQERSVTFSSFSFSPSSSNFRSCDPALQSCSFVSPAHCHAKERKGKERRNERTNEQMWRLECWRGVCRRAMKNAQDFKAVRASSSKVPDIDSINAPIHAYIYI